MGDAIEARPEQPDRELWIDLDAPDTHGPKPDFAHGQAFGRSLRVALAMKGGVSLAVWIGGAVAELDILRRIRIIRDGAELHRYLLTDPADPSGASDPRSRAGVRGGSRGAAL